MTATLAHIHQRYTLLAICNDCAHTVELDVDGLIDTLGPDHPVPAIKKRILIRMFLQDYELGFCPLVFILS